MEGILPLLPFGKRKASLTLRGVTNDDVDICVDTLRNVTLPLLFPFGVRAGVGMEVKKRGAPPAGDGMVTLTVSTVSSLRPVRILDAGLVKRIRGVAYTTRVSPQFGNRMVESAK